MKVTSSGIIRWFGLSAVLAGIIFAGIQPFHPPDVVASVSTGAWGVIQPMKTAMCLLCLLGILGIYARQVEKAGWLGLVGALLFGFSWALQTAYVFAEAFILPPLAAAAPAFVAGFLGIFNGSPTETNIGQLSTLYGVVGILYVVGGLLFGVATFRAAILPRWAGALLAAGSVLPLLLTSFVSHPLDRYFAVPVGIALVWLGYSLWAETRAQAVETVGTASPQLRQVGAK